MPPEPAQAFEPLALDPQRVIARLQARVSQEVLHREQLEVAVEMLIERCTAAAARIAELEAEAPVVPKVKIERHGTESAHVAD